MTIEPPPSIDFNFYEQPSTISHFDGVIQDLKQDLATIGIDSSFTAPELAHFVARFLKFQQDELNNTNDKQPFPARIPISFFNVDTLAKPSPLYTILLSAYTFQSDKDISDWQLDAPEEKETNVELVRVITRQLIQDEFYRPPVIAFDESVDNEQDIEEWTRMINSLGGNSL